MVRKWRFFPLEHKHVYFLLFILLNKLINIIGYTSIIIQIFTKQYILLCKTMYENGVQIEYSCTLENESYNNVYILTSYRPIWILVLRIFSLPHPQFNFIKFSIFFSKIYCSILIWIYSNICICVCIYRYSYTLTYIHICVCMCVCIAKRQVEDILFSCTEYIHSGYKLLACSNFTSHKLLWKIF